MEFLQYYQNWIKGELVQAKFMLFFGAIMLICMIIILRSESQILKGLIVPLGLSIIALIGYGGFIIQDRNNRLTKIETEFSQKKSLSLKEEEERKIEEGITTCKVTIKVWAAVIVVGIILFFYFTQPYYKGIAIGLILLGSSLLLIDVFIDKRAKTLYPNFAKMELGK